MRQLDEMMHHHAALLEQTNAAIEQTEALADELDRVVAVFTVKEAPAAYRQSRQGDRAFEATVGEICGLMHQVRRDQDRAH